MGNQKNNVISTQCYCFLEKLSLTRTPVFTAVTRATTSIPVYF